MKFLGSLQNLKTNPITYRVKNYFTNSYEFITPVYNNYSRVIGYKFRNIIFNNFVEIRSYIKNVNEKLTNKNFL